MLFAEAEAGVGWGWTALELLSVPELVAKALAIQGPDRVALWTAGFLNTFVRLTRPLIVLMSGTANLLLRLFGYQPAGRETLIHSVDELSLLIEDAEEAGNLDPDQA